MSESNVEHEVKNSDAPIEIDQAAEELEMASSKLEKRPSLCNGTHIISAQN